MISEEFKKQYVINKTPINEAYEYQLALKENEEYEKLVNEAFIKICTRFMQRYKGVKIEPPRGREKSPKSLMGKIKKLEIERLSKLYILGKISNQEKKELYDLIQERIQVSNLKDDKKLNKAINVIFEEKIENADLLMLADTITQDGISDHTKMTLLRMLIEQINNKELKNIDKGNILEQIDDKYGKNAAIRENNSEKDLIKYNEVQELKKKENEIEKLNNPRAFLKAKDLRGIKIVISYVPKDIDTDNEKLKQLIEKREQSNTNEEKVKLNDLCCIELEKEFMNELMSDFEFLNDLGIEVYENSYKHKIKTNGYIADHVKFKGKENPEFVFELQLRSMYREELSGPNGPAAHDKRPGKERRLPNIRNKKHFIEDLKYRIPKYILLKGTENGYEIHKCTTLENTIAYYQSNIDPDTEYFDEIVQILEENEKCK